MLKTDEHIDALNIYCQIAFQKDLTIYNPVGSIKVFSSPQ